MVVQGSPVDVDNYHLDRNVVCCDLGVAYQSCSSIADHSKTDNSPLIPGVRPRPIPSGSPLERRDSEEGVCPSHNRAMDYPVALGVELWQAAHPPFTDRTYASAVNLRRLLTCRFLGFSNLRLRLLPPPPDQLGARIVFPQTRSENGLGFGVNLTANENLNSDDMVRCMFEFGPSLRFNAGC